MKKQRVSRVGSKLAKTGVVSRSRVLAAHVPATRRFGRERLRAMLRRHGMVYVKPNTGSQGIGILRVDTKRGRYRYRKGMQSRTFASFGAMYGAMRSFTDGRRYLVQRGIHTLRRNGRVFDFRVMIQRNPAGRWECTGTAGRVAHPGKIVSNGSQGGTIYSANALLRPIAGRAGAKRVQRRMNRLARLTAAQFGRAYPAMNELGIDIAVDRRLKPWILEVNTAPDPCPFTKLNDRTAIRRIVRYARAYGRRYSLTCNKAKRGG
ncbi:YheC/YheD family protein [Cohnella sp. GCM10027633]|uniref:YheC/YheD family protein n=1 Tax=unclassified Cohnella TaxID=2636738 RepID=UPI003641AEF0